MVRPKWMWVVLSMEGVAASVDARHGSSPFFHPPKRATIIRASSTGVSNEPKLSSHCLERTLDRIAPVLGAVAIHPSINGPAVDLCYALGGPARRDIARTRKIPVHPRMCWCLLQPFLSVEV